MTELLMSQITEWKGQMDSLQSEVLELEKRMENCHHAIRRIEEKESDYDEFCYRGKENSLNVFSIFPDIRFSQHYGESMEQILTLEDYKNTMFTFEDMKEFVREQAKRIESDIQDCYGQIRELSIRIEDNERQMEEEKSYV